jgi:hypothetical protein
VRIGLSQLGHEPTNSYGANLSMRRLAPEFVGCASASSVDVLCLSLFWWLHVWELPAWLRRAGILQRDGKRVGPRIYVGGFQTFNPMPLLPYVDGVWVGDGDDLTSLEELEGGAYRGTGLVQYRSVPVLPSWSQTVRTGTRIEIARGCKRRCAFCAVSHLKPYREVPFEQVAERVRESHGPVMLFAPSTSHYSARRELEDLCSMIGVVRADTDVTFDELGVRERGWAQRFGLDGLSERLRASVRKPLRNDALVERIGQMLEGKDRLAIYFYLIVDLPGEGLHDWLEYRETIGRICDLAGSATLHINPLAHAFMPMPHTALEGAGINLEAPIMEWLRRAYRGFEKRTPIVARLHRVQAFHPVSRLLSMIAVRAGLEFADIERAATAAGLLSYDGRQLRYSYSLSAWERVLAPFGGFDRYCAPRAMDDRPWKCVLTHSAHEIKG